MNQILALLREKNSLLEKFYSLNRNEIQNITDQNFSNIEKFYQDREDILGIIRLIDRKIDESNNTADSLEEVDTVSDEIRIEMRELLSFKKAIVEKILSQDLGILSQIDDEKSRIIVELSKTGTQKKAIGSYKSKGKRNHRLDESF
ncbi:MAG: hypothetical protein HOO06_09285 [Bdellovibrionaceae bacterium]|nr:hypothetical protein [Pseudobdellovibrionaceae bacterium]